MTIKTFTSRSTKQEILKAYAELAKEFKQGRANTSAAEDPSPPASSAKSVASRQDSEDSPVTTGQASIDTIIRDLSGIRARLGESVGSLQQQLLSEATRLQAMRSEATEYTDQLRELHGIEVDEDTLRGLVHKYQETQRSADEYHTARKQGFEVELEAKKVAWRKEQEEHTRTSKEAAEAAQRARKREAEEYAYDTQRTHKADADNLEQAKKQRAAELADLREQHARSWAERELAVTQREKEYAELKAKSEAAPKELEAAVAKAETEGSNIAKRQAKLTADLQQKEIDGQRRVFELRVAELEQTLTKQNEQINDLSQQLARALKQAQDLAMKAIDGASNSSSFAAVKEIALEQAKTSQKNK